MCESWLRAFLRPRQLQCDSQAPEMLASTPAVMAVVVAFAAAVAPTSTISVVSLLWLMIVVVVVVVNLRGFFPDGYLVFSPPLADLLVGSFARPDRRCRISVGACTIPPQWRAVSLQLRLSCRVTLLGSGPCRARCRPRRFIRCGVRPSTGKGRKAVVIAIELCFTIVAE